MKINNRNSVITLKSTLDKETLDNRLKELSDTLESSLEESLNELQNKKDKN